MKLSNRCEIRSSQIKREIEYFLTITNIKHWEKVIHNIENTTGYFYKKYLYIRNPLARIFQIYFKRIRDGLTIHQPLNQEIYFLATTAYIFNLLYNNFSKHAKNILIGRMKSDDIRSLLFEFNITSHLFRNDFDVDFIEYENKDHSNRIFDLLLLKGDKELELECKYKEYDSSRKITRPALYLLLDQITNKIEINKFNGIVAFEFKKKLSKNRSNQEDIIKKLDSKLNSHDWSKSEYDNFYLEIFPIEFLEPLNSSSKVLNMIKPYYTNDSHFVSLCTNKSNFLLRFSTLQNENISAGIYDSLKNSIDQFSKTRAGIIACHIEGIFPEEWERLKDEGALLGITKHILSNEKNNFIHSICFSSKPEESQNNGIFSSITPFLSFNNPNAKFHNKMNTRKLIGI